MSNDSMVAVLAYQLEAKECEERMARRLAAREHPGFSRRPSLWKRARRMFDRSPLSSRGSVEPG